MTENNSTSVDLRNVEEVNKAIAMLAIRVSTLEIDAPAMGKSFYITPLWLRAERRCSIQF